ncbi:MAG: relaxase/mobilization nuclease domain-containing protein [Coriobacteriia bacterium]|nr:relaxase/mobilization nuclease domain-containing protein [Coriobacteriia bacterium]
MAVTKIWPIRGWLGQVVVYVENPGKTIQPKSFERSGMDESARQGLKDVIDYAMAANKTVADEGEQAGRCFVSGVNCTATDARNQMLRAKERFNKENGIIAFHGYQSFALGEVTPEVAHEIGVKLAQQLWGDRYQVIVATHLDKEHIHNHLLINSVSFIDGFKFRNTKADYYALRDTSDVLCREYGLSVIENPQSGKSKHHAERQADHDGKPTWRSVIKSDIDECISRARTERQFFENLDAMGYEYKIGADISVRPPDKERFFRLGRNFGDVYTPEGIRTQIREGAHRRQILPVPTQRHPDFVPPKKLPAFARGSIVALHRHYLYLLGYYQQRGNPSTNARMHWLLREDIRKLDAYIDDTRLLGRENIETAKELQAFKMECESGIAGLVQERTKLRAKIRAEAGPGNSYTTKGNPQYQEINARLRKLRKELAQCERIRLRSHTLPERIDRIERDEEKKLQPSPSRSNRSNKTGTHPRSSDNDFQR